MRTSAAIKFSRQTAACVFLAQSIHPFIFQTHYNAFIFRGDCFAPLPFVFAALVSLKLRSKAASSQPTKTREAAGR
jgi:hypothetical protein